MNDDLHFRRPRVLVNRMGRAFPRLPRSLRVDSHIFQSLRVDPHIFQENPHGHARCSRQPQTQPKFGLEMRTRWTQTMAVHLRFIVGPRL
jgi:hypothetical protein